MTKEKIENLSKLVPVGGIFIILCSSVKQIIFYNQFNISITDYLGIGEYATLFIDDIIYYLAIFGLGILLNETSNSRQKTHLNQEIENFDNSRYRNYRIWIVINSFIVILGVIILILYTESLSEKLDSFKVGFFMLLCLLYGYLQNLKTSFKFSYRSLIVLAILFYTAMDGFIDAQKIIERDNKLDFKMSFENKEITTDHDLNYLGKSERFIYLYNLKMEEALILSISKLDRIEIIEKQ